MLEAGAGQLRMRLMPVKGADMPVYAIRIDVEVDPLKACLLALVITVIIEL